MIKSVFCALAATVFFVGGITFAADSEHQIAAKFKSRDQAIHLMDDWMRDPFIVKGSDGLFYLSCTRLDHVPGKKQGIEIWRSKDLQAWEYVGVPWSIEDSAWLPEVIAKTEIKHESGKYLLWAPEVHFLDGKWVCVHTANIGKANLFLNDSPQLKGPFVEPMGVDLGRRHDPSIFTDDDGSHWLIWGCAQIQQLKPDFSGFVGKKYDLFPSNRKMGHEGCQIIKVGGKYVLFGTAWSTDQMRQGTYNLYYCTADKIEGPYGERKFAGRCLGHGTIFQDGAGQWWCTAFLNGQYMKPGDAAYDDPDIDKAITMNPQGLSIIPMDIRMVDGDVVVNALDPHYASAGPEEIQLF